MRECGLFPNWLVLSAGGANYFGGRRAHSPLAGQASPANLIEQSAVADFQRASSPFAVPAIGFQDAQYNLTLEVMNRLASYFLEMDLAFDWNFRSRVSMLPAQEFAGNGVFRAEDYVPFH